MVYVLEDTQKVIKLFEGWEETLIYSCLQKVMGKVYVTDEECPKSAMAHIGSFVFLAGEPEKELVQNRPEGFVIMVPQSKEWETLIEECCPGAKWFERHAIKKNTVFDKEKLQKLASAVPQGYELRKIDRVLYDKCLQNPATADFVAAFESKEQYLELGLGYVLLKGEEIVSGASSYTGYKQGIEIEVDTVESERGKGLATVCCATLILKCLEKRLYPSWDAHNLVSVHLAEKLGYEYSHSYTAYEVAM